MNHITLLVTPISELTEAEFTYLLAHRDEIKALDGTPEHIAALMVRSNEDHAKRVAAKASAKSAAIERRRRIKEEAGIQKFLHSFLTPGIGKSITLG